MQFPRTVMVLIRLLIAALMAATWSKPMRSCTELCPRPIWKKRVPNTNALKIFDAALAMFAPVDLVICRQDRVKRRRHCSKRPGR